MSEIFDILFSGIDSNNEVRKNKGRKLYMQLAIVARTNDPKNLRRIRVYLPDKGGRVESDWMFRLSQTPFNDHELPKVGQTVLVAFVEGNPHRGVIMGVLGNLANPPFEDKQNIDDDHYQAFSNDVTQTVGNNLNLDIINDRTVEVGDDDSLKVANERRLEAKSEKKKIEVDKTTEVGVDYEVKVGASFRLSTTSGSFIEMSPLGTITLGDAFGHRWELGGIGGSTWTWNAAGSKINVINARDFEINGKSVATVGALDNDGDRLISRGYEDNERYN